MVYLNGIRNLNPILFLRKVNKRILRLIKVIKKIFEVKIIIHHLKTEYFTNRRFDMKFPDVFDYNSKYNNWCKKHLNIDDQTVINQANKSVNHIFSIYDSEYYFGREIVWNLDFRSKYKWEDKFYLKIKLVDYTNNADVKIPWELSRFHHLINMGQAYAITSDETYAIEFANQIYSWINSNSYSMTVNWTCAMEVAIRACNWIASTYYFSKSDLPKSFWTMFNKTLYLHGIFIFNNLEKKKISNNHYISNLIGLIWIGTYFRGFSFDNNQADDWIKFSISKLELELLNQVYEDGSNFEASTAYHCLVTELILNTVLLCESNNLQFSTVFLDRLEKMCHLVADLIKPNGIIPLIGDSDSGRFMVLRGYGIRNTRDFRDLLYLASSFFKKKYLGCSIYQMLNQNIYRTNQNDIQISTWKLTSYIEGGYYIFKSGQVFFLVRCGKNGSMGKGGHTHNDQLSFEINVRGQDFLIDPGSFVYSADYKERNLFRSTISHNTLYVNGIEQNSFNNLGIFSLRDETSAKTVMSENDYFRGKHYGYKEKIGLVHTREFRFCQNMILITDSLEKDNTIYNSNLGYNIGCLSFILEHEVETLRDKATNSIQLKKNDTSITLNFSYQFEILDTYVSYEYGKKVKSKKIVVRFDINTCDKIETKITI